MRISKVTTKTGDKGETGLGDGKRISKSHPNIKLLGDIDELNSVLGLAITSCTNQDMVQELKAIQQDLLNMGGEVSMPESEIELLSENRIIFLEELIEKMNLALPPLKEFILPGGDEFSARIHLTRAVCRRVERSCVTFIDTGVDKNHWLRYLNRLSDYFFVLARFTTQNSGGSETFWERNS